MINHTDHATLFDAPHCDNAESGAYALFDSDGIIRETKDARGVTTYFDHRHGSITRTQVNLIAGQAQYVR